MMGYVKKTGSLGFCLTEIHREEEVIRLEVFTAG